jgi:hypothetical protein
VYGIPCTLLILLWARSYWWWDSALFGDCYTVNNSLQGQLSLGLGGFFGANAWGWDSAKARKPDKKDRLRQVLGREPSFSFCSSKSANRLIVFVPHWFAVVSAACRAVVAWLPRRFSLPALLIATTLVAVVSVLILWQR